MDDFSEFLYDIFADFLSTGGRMTQSRVREPQAQADYTNCMAGSKTGFRGSKRWL